MTEFSKAGACLRKRIILHFAIASLFLPTLFPGPSAAADIFLSSQTYLLYYKRDVPGSDKQTFAPAYEYFSGDARGLGGKPVSFHVYGWSRLDLGDESGEGRRTGELASAYLQYLHPTGNGEVRLGRFFLADGAAAEIIDGIFLKTATPAGIGVSAFGAAPRYLFLRGQSHHSWRQAAPRYPKPRRSRHDIPRSWEPGASTAWNVTRMSPRGP